MAVPKTKLGRMKCPCCGESVMVKENEAGTLTMQCDECDLSAFAKKGTGAALKWRAALPKAAAPGPAPGALQEPAKAPAKAPAGKTPGTAPGALQEPAKPVKVAANPFDYFNLGRAPA